MKPNKAVVTKEDLIVELKDLSEKYIKKYPDSKHVITRAWYRENTSYGEEYTKHFDSFKDFISEVFEEDLDEFRVQKQISEIKRENQELKKDKDKLLKQVISEEKILELYKENLTKDFKYKLPPVKTKFKSNKDLLLNLSDLHLGEEVIPEQVSMVNKFNKEIALHRLDQLFDQVVKYAKKIIVQNLYIEFNGDLFCGGIHQELIRNSDLNEVEAIFYLEKYLIPKLIWLSQFFNNIFIDVVVGNHSRILPGKVYYKEKTVMNYEYIFGRQLKMHFDLMTECKKNSKIHINVPESPFIIKQVKNTRFLVTHGDILTGEGSGGFLGIPAYSTAMSAAKLYGVLHQIGVQKMAQFDHIIAAHIHSTSKIPIFNGGFVFYNGCIIGTNEFSLYKMKGVAKKEQLLLIIDDDGIDGEMNLRLN